ncbi:SDR family NAD(P)-dependent oxidoreductase [Streptomyces physcomitrii]|uniref:SDR family NAD(P)-dependent oxidoreductase n=1 Tax=Streptomyces physcomitrii TaxID=2724184 RepID=UPI003422F337
MGTAPVRTLADILRTHALERPEVIAYVDKARSLTYSALESSTARLAGHFAEWGIAPGSNALICLGNRVEMVESALALTRAELVGIPVNPHSSDAEIAHILTDSEAVLVITDESRADLFRALDEGSGRLHRVVVADSGKITEGDPRLHDHRTLRTTEPTAPARDGMRPEDLAWMLYTSGTTGAPKGVLSTQYAGLWSAAHGYTALLGIEPGDRLLWPLPLHHSFAFNLCVLGVVTAGATARIMADFAPDEVLAELRDGQYSLMAAVPATLHQLVAAAEEIAPALGGLRALLVAGALTGAALGERFRTAFGVPLIDSYGSSETTGVITCNTLHEPRRPGSCGKAVPGIGVRVVDPRTRRDRTAGEEGEIWVSSPSLMTGYHRAPEQSARAFHDGWYRTGDMGTLDEDGYLRITGRLKELIIRGGENMHPAEIEDVLRESPEVADAAVVARPHTRLGEVPVAYLVPRPGHRLPVAALVRRLRERLAYFKVPAELRLTGRIPRTASGKTLRRLVAEEPSRLLAATASHHPRLLAAAPGHPALPATLPAEDTSPLAGRPVLLLTPGTVPPGATGPTDRTGDGPGPADSPSATAPGAAEGPAPDPIRQLADHLATQHGCPDVHQETAPEAWCATAARHPDHALVLVVPQTAAAEESAHEAANWAAEAGQLTGELTAAGRTVLLLGTEPGVTPAGLRDALDAALLEGATEVRVRATDLPAPALPTALAPDPDRAARLAGALGALTGPARRGRLLALVGRALSDVLGTPFSDSGDARKSFRSLGFDSLASVELRNRLVAETGLALPASVAFDHPNPGALADHLHTALLGAPAPVPATAAHPLSSENDPIVLVGAACRFPGGVRSPEELWELVASGGDAVGPFPEDRGWDLEGLFASDPEVPGTTYATQGGFLGRVADFDAEFFGISPREALAMDPQQRLLLETSWELLENAGIDPDSLRGSRTGVFAGQMYQDYAQRLTEEPGLDGYLSTGLAGSVLSGRLSYFYGFEGPALTVDTACSSSLVALHLAAESLRRGECSLALAGGVAVMSTPASFVDFSRQRGLAADGRCKPFAAAADGTGWSEGVGLLLVERLSDARRNGHEVLAVVRGSAVNQDGASNGLSAPNGPSQQRVIRQALANSGLSAGDVDAVEAHGTGTALGDPIEAQALLATYGQERAEGRPLLVGAVKSNLGHTQAAAGVAGVLKMVWAMREGLLPRTLHVEQPSPHVDWSSGAVELLTGERAWPSAGDRPRRAAVSSFGISGTNAHVILEEAPAPAAGEENPRDTAAAPGWAAPLVLSARSEPGLRAQAAALHAHLTERPELPLRDAAFTLATTRATLEHRAAFPAQHRDPLLRALSALAEGTPTPDTFRGKGAPQGGASAFLFTGQGAQRAGMGRELYASFPVFAEAFDAVCAELDACLSAGESLKAVVFGGDAGLLERTGWAQPALFAVEVALFRLVESWGVRPDFLLGHSIGEIAAAHVAGVFSLADAAQLVVARGRLMQALPSGGAMLAVSVAAEEAARLCAGYVGRVEVAAVNGPLACVLSGDADALAEIEEAAREAGHRVKRLAVSHAFHSPRMDPMLAEFAAVVGGLSLSEPRIPLVSNVTGELAQPAELTSPDYWVRHVRQTVLFHDGVRTLAAAGVTRFLELGPEAVLTALVREALPAAGEGADPVAVPVLRSDAGEERSAAAALGALFCAGVVPDWRAVYGSSPTTRVPLPTYPFQGRRYWPSLPMKAAGGGPRAEELLYEVVWEPLDLAPGTGGPAQVGGVGGAGTWLAVTDTEDAFTGECLAALAAAGAEVVRLPLTGELDRAALAEQLSQATAAARPSRIVALLHGEHAPLHGLLLLQAAADCGTEARLHLVTRGAVEVGSPEGAPAPEGGSRAAREQGRVRVDQAQLWGLGRVAALEAPGTWGGLVDLPEPEAYEDGDGDAAHASVARAFAAQLMGGSAEGEVAVRADGAHARRLVAVPKPRAAAETGEPWAASGTGTVLVTGGTGALGAKVARHLAKAGVAHLLLTGRRGPDAPGAAELRAELVELGAEVTLDACDVADGEALAALLDGIPADRPLTGVVHAAGVLDDGVLTALTPERLERVLAAKTGGALHLDRLTRAYPLDTFVLFSSLAGVVGAAGQANYAMANAALDALAVRRRQEGLPATAVAWGAWEGEGMAAEATAVRERLRRTGMRPMRARAALGALEAVLRSGRTAVLAADVDWERYGQALGAAAVAQRGLLRQLLALPAAPTAPGDAGPNALLASLTGRPADQQQALLVELIRTHAAELLMHESAEAVDPAKSFRVLGFDSLASVELRNRLALATGLALPASLAFDRPSPEVLAAFLRTELLGDPEAVREAALPHPVTTGDDPIVLVGAACRFPGGVRSPEELWELVASGGDAVGPFPEDRGWDLEGLFASDPEVPGTTYATQGGFLRQVAEFDAEFFGISPREALAMDPQQRLLLETSWELLENAGVLPGSLRGSRTGVFVGSNGQDYTSLVARSAEDLEGYLGTGGAVSVASGRLSYFYGFEGPALTVDTACSSSLVALHLAAESLRRGECSLALAGGVTVMSTPQAFVDFSRQRGLAADGRCRAFAADAEGTGWGEGVGLLLVERLSDARRNGHEVLAVVRGSAINQDGASNGLSAPNGPSQQRVIRQALANSGLSGGDVDAVEAHGTGTALGDPIEAQALLATYGQERAEGRPLLVGAVKSNLGHTQAAAGVAGVLKMVWAMREGLLPRTLHVDEPSPHVDWSSGAVELLTGERAWPSAGDRPRRAAVSSFGISGTNAHIILEEAPAFLEEIPGPDLGQAPAEQPSEGQTPVARVPVPLLLSAPSPEALRDQADRLRAHLAAHPDLDLTEVGRALAQSRTSFPYRTAPLADPRDPAAVLDALATAGTTPETTSVQPGGLAFLFTGQGAQRPDMGRELYESFPAFAEAFDAVCAELDRHLGRSLKGVVFGGEAEELNRTGWGQPALFALEVALFRLVESWGVRPDFLLGHSIGEIAAAQVAGVFSLADAAQLVAARGRLMQALPSGGAMLAVSVAAEEAARLCAGYAGRVEVAAVNGPLACVLSGDADAVAEIEEAARQAGHRVKLLAVSHAFHSPRMDLMLAEFATVVGGLTLSEPRIPLVSNVTGEPAKPAELTSPDYWVRHVRQSVLFHDGIRTLAAAGVTRFLELGPDAVLTALAQDCLGASGAVPGAVGAGQPSRAPRAFAAVLRRDRSEPRTVAALWGELFRWEVPVDWAACLGRPAGRVPLPTYAFRKVRYWPRPRSGSSHEPGAHPLLDGIVERAGSAELLFTGRLSVRTHPWLTDHVVGSAVLLPGTGFVEMALYAGRVAGAGALEELTVQAPLRLTGSAAVEVQVAVAPLGAAEAAGEEGPERWSVTVYGRAAGDPEAAWTRHATGVLGPEPQAPPAFEEPWPPRDAEQLDPAEIYLRAEEMGFGYGPALRGLRAVWRRGEEIFAEVALEGEDGAGHLVHPALLDAALHTGFVDTPGAGDTAGRLPFVWQGVTVAGSEPAAGRVRLRRLGEDELSLDLRDVAGRTAVHIASLKLRRAGSGDLAPAGVGLRTLEWEPLARELPSFAGEVAVLGADPAGVAKALGADAHPDLKALEDSFALPDAVVRALDLTGPSGTEDSVREARRAVWETATLLREWVESPLYETARLTLLVPASGTGTASGAVRAMLRTAQSEHPGKIQVVASDSGLPAAALAAEERELAVLGDELHVPRLVPAQAPGGDAWPELSGGAVLITGGTGGLGAVLARHLVRAHGVRDLVLLSRAAGEQRDAELAAALRESGAEVALVACEVTDRAALAQVVEGLGRPLTAVFHAAGIVDDGLLTGLTEEQFSRVMEVKAEGALALHEVTAKQAPGAFVLFSSAAGVHGSPAQANYAAANGFLDAFAVHLHGLGLPALSLQWGPWAEERGMAGRLGADALARMARHGTLPLGNEEALSLLDAALAAGGPPNLVAVKEAAPAAAPRRAPRPAPAAGPPLAAQLAAADEAQRGRLLGDLVHLETAAVLGHGGGARIAGEKSFRELGLDSLAAVELRNRLGERTGLSLTPTLVFDFPTPAALTEHLVAELAPAADAPAQSVIRGLDELERMLRAAGPGSATERYAEQRLRALMAQVGGAARKSESDEARAAMDVSDEELFEILDGEIGI